MAKKKKIKTQVGDLFAISIGHGKYCFGQAVGAIVEGEKMFPHTFIVFDLVGGLDTPIEKICSTAILLLFNTVDVSIEDGEWPLIGHENVPQIIKFPEYKVHSGGSIMVTGVDGQFKRVATPEEIKTLGYMKSISPGTVERMLEAHFGDAEWKDYYDKLFYRE